MKNSTPATCTLNSVQIDRRSRMYAMAARTRPLATSGSGAAAGRPCAVASTIAITRKSAQLTSSAMLVLDAATIAPPMAGPAMKQSENAVLLTALPSRSRSADAVTWTVAARASDRATSAITPSTAVKISTGPSEKLLAIQASARNASPSRAYNAGSTCRGVRWSSLATMAGAISAGTNSEHRKNAIAPRALSVRA